MISHRWVEDCAAVKRALGGDGSRYAFLTDEWYAGVASRIHLNSLRADAEGETVALYALPSFLNHHWEPNLLVDYGDDDVCSVHKSSVASMAWRSTRPLSTKAP